MFMLCCFSAFHTLQILVSYMQHPITPPTQVKDIPRTHLIKFGTIAKDQAHVGHKLCSALVMQRMFSLQFPLYQGQVHWMLYYFIVIGYLERNQGFSIKTITFQTCGSLPTPNNLPIDSTFLGMICASQWKSTIIKAKIKI